MDSLFVGIVFACNQDGTFTIPYKPEDVFTALKAIIYQIPGFRVKSINDFGFTIDGNFGMSWRSWGEAVLISVLSSPSSNSTLSIKSKSKMGIVDFGKNRENINNILTALQQELINSNCQLINANVQKTDPTDKLFKLKALMDNNIISKEEYESKKEELLNLL